MKYAQAHNADIVAPIPFKSVGQAARDSDQSLVITILIATVAYQIILCFCNTNIFSTSRSIVGVAESLLYVACMPFLLRRLVPGVLILALLAGGILCFTASIGGILNIKAFRDLIIPLCYFWVGCNIGKPEVAERALRYVISVVLVLAVAESFFLDQYTTVFNIYKYYISTGNLTLTEWGQQSNLQLNGMRPEGIGRTLLPSLLGPHRVSSVFLEPVSLGNFATMCAAWGLSRNIDEWRNGLFFLTISIVLMVFSDSRFALLSVTLMIIMRIFIQGKALNLAVLMPFICIALLLFVGENTLVDELEDNFRGRLALSGWSLLDFDVPTLLGAIPGQNFGDQGYAYALSNFGLPVCLLMWFSFWLLPMPDERGVRFRAFVAIYVSLILCVSGNSLFALKTAGIVWFLLGCCMMLPAPAPKKTKAFGLANPPVEPDTETFRKNHVS